jgi:membrane protease YdiL (CAAX protease family)
MISQPIPQTTHDKTGQDHFFSRARHWAILRIVVLSVVLIAIVVTTGIISKVFIQPLPLPLRHNLLMVINLSSAVALLIGYSLVVRLMEQRDATEIGLRKGAPQLLMGALLGTGLMSAVYLVLWALGRATFTSGNGLDGLLGALVVMFAVGVLEELLLRAVLFRIVEQMGGTTVAVLFSAVVFGLLHAVNPGAALWSSAAIALEAGVMLALAYALTHNLWLAIGIHAGWNFAEGSIFGARVSGTSEAHSLVKSSLSGPDLLTGGGFGPEASIFSVGVCLAFSVILLILIIRRGDRCKSTFQLRLA